MKELMILVERAVRPVCADNRRKMKMRQELLAHLTAAYEQERTRLGDEQAALAEAARRFGDPKELTKSLQASVPVWDRVLFMPVPGTKWISALERAAAPRSAASPTHRATVWVVVWLLICLELAGVAFSLYQAGGERDGARLVGEWLGLTTGMTGAFLAFTFLTFRALSGPLRLSAVVQALTYAALAVFPPVVLLSAYLQWRLELPINIVSQAVGSATAFLGLLGVAMLARLQSAATRLREEWTSLEIGD